MANSVDPDQLASQKPTDLCRNSVDPDQLASQKPTDLDLHCLQMQGISYPGSAGQGLRCSNIYGKYAWRTTAWRLG